MGNGLPAAVGQAVIGTVLIIIGAFAPLVLFRLLAFVDPATSSGQAFRASLDAAGGVAGLLGGRGQGTQGGQGEGSGISGAATATSGDGSSSQGEADAAAATQSRLDSAMGPVGSTLGALSTAGQIAAAFGADVLGAAGVGHPQPYFATPPNNQKPDHTSKPQGEPANGKQDPGNGGPGSGDPGSQRPTADGQPPPPTGDPVVDLPPPPPMPGPPGTPGSANGGGDLGQGQGPPAGGAGNGKTGSGPGGGEPPVEPRSRGQAPRPCESLAP